MEMQVADGYGLNSIQMAQPPLVSGKRGTVVLTAIVVHPIGI